MFRRLLETNIEINGSPEKIWEILTNLEEYQKWNPFIIEAEGEIRLNKKISVKISPPGSKPMIFKPVIKSFERNKKFSWLGNLIFPGLFDGHHIFEIQQNESNSILIQKEEFSGILVPLFWSKLKTDTKAGFELMNKEVKKIVEQSI